jgi:condensin complex subunit 2
LQIGYAKQAKKMDMRRLKAIEWNLLTTVMSGSGDHNEKENESDNVDTEMADGDEKKSGTTTFGHLYKKLHVSKQMPQQMAENLSVPLAFVALLHLCNENNLSLESRPDLTDFSIRQG